MRIWFVIACLLLASGYSTTAQQNVNGDIYITDTSSELGAQVNAAIATLTRGGVIHIAPGSYKQSTTIVINKASISLECSGSGDLWTTFGATLINVAAATTAVSISAGSAFAKVQDCHFISASSVAGTDDGILDDASFARLENNTLSHFGGSGIYITDKNGNADSFYLVNNVSYQNFGDGFTTIGTSLEDGTAINCVAIDNAGWGFNLSNLDLDWFVNLESNDNLIGGVRVNQSGSVQFDVPYFSGSPVSSSFVVTSTSTGIAAHFLDYGAPTTITDNGAATYITEYYDGVGMSQSQLVLAPNRKYGYPTNPTAWMMISGSYLPGSFMLKDTTDYAIAYVCVRLTAACTFFAPTTSTNFISTVATGTAPLKVVSTTPVANLTLSSNTQVPAINLAATGNGGVTGQLPIGKVGSAGLSGTSPIVVSSTGAISCPTCATSAGGATATAPLTSPLPVANGETAVSAPLTSFIIPPNMPSSAMPSATANAIYWHEFYVPAPGLTITHIAFDVAAADSSSNDFYDVCVYSIGGTLEADLGPTAGGTGNTFASTGIKNIAIVQSGGRVTLPAGVYLVGFTGDATTAKIMGQYGDQGSFTAYGESLPNASSNGQCNSSVSVPSPTYTQTTGQAVPWVAFY